MLFLTESPYLVLQKSKDPENNIAAEEFLFSQRRENFIFIWQNSPCVVIGKNQIVENEVAKEYRNTLPVIKRSTGGGAVYHDENNINFSFIKNDSSIPTLEKFTQPIRDFLKSLGVETELSGKNDILLDGKKISGTASRIQNGRILFHGTLLFKCDFEKMEKILTPNREKLMANGVASVKARVGEIAPYCNVKTVEEFRNLLIEYLVKEEKSENINIKCKYF